MDNMIAVKERRKRIFDFINISVAMMLCNHALMLFTNWIQSDITAVGYRAEMVVEICRLFGSFLIIVIAANQFDRLQTKH